MSRSVVRSIEEISDEESDFQRRLVQYSSNFQRQRGVPGSRRFYSEPIPYEPHQVVREVWRSLRQELAQMSSGRGVIMITLITLLMLIMGFIGLIITRKEKHIKKAEEKENSTSGNVPDPSSFSMGF